MQRTEHAVAIVGGGPTGMVLAAELALADVDVVVLERRADHAVVGARAGGLHARTIELLDQRGVADRFLAASTLHDEMPFGTTTLSLADMPTRHPYYAGIWQSETERLLGDWLAELPARVRHGVEVLHVAQDDTGVDVVLAGGETVRAGWVVGCDGGRSLVRKAAGVPFPGWEATRSNLIAELETTDPPPLGLHHDDAGVHAFAPLGDGRAVRVVTTERTLKTGREPTVDDLRSALAGAFGSDFGVHGVRWLSRFTDATRQAAAYRAGRILLAGDAAHVHYPVGGYGLSLGVQDAVNLGWKLAQVVHETVPDGLLDTYHAERHPATARLLRHTLALGALQRRDDRMQALVALVSDLAELDEPRRRLVALGSGLDVHLDLGEGHPLLGRRMPDLDLETDEGPVRVSALLHDARPVLLRLGGPGGPDVGPWTDRVRGVAARCAGPWELPALGTVPAPDAVLIRPDGYVAWAGDGGAVGLAAALERWFGPPGPAA